LRPSLDAVEVPSLKTKIVELKWSTPVSAGPHGCTPVSVRTRWREKSNEKIIRKEKESERERE
jgi:hypothetical protein